MSELFHPPGGWRVRILDLSGGAEDNIVEDVPGFATLMQANEFARRYVRDSIERCRAPGLTAQDVLAAWFAYGEDAEVLESGDAGFRSAPNLPEFSEHPATAEDRNWRALDPRNQEPDDPEGDGA